jgi:hypothetical protein
MVTLRPPIVFCHVELIYYESFIFADGHRGGGLSID